jgi:single-strand DNA-binding protein
MIKLTLIGNLGRDAILRDVQGKHVISFSVAHTEKYKDSTGAQKDKTVWVECSYWSERINLVPFLKKGGLIYVEGQPHIDVYENKVGEKVAGIKLRVTLVQILSNKTLDGSSHSGETQDHHPLSKAEDTSL